MIKKNDFYAHFNNIQLYPNYQPIVSISKHKIIGFEGLIRGITIDNKHVYPKELFEIAKSAQSTIVLDRLCRDVILNNFISLDHNPHNNHLFVNIDPSIIETVLGSNYLIDQVVSCGIDPENIVIEIIESKTDDTEKLLKFVSKYKSMGFLIALDDLGTGFSNLERISTIKPDIIKIDRSLISSIETDIHKQEFFKSITRFANMIGTIVVAEGIETEAEAFLALEYGAHLLQGFYFSRPEILDQNFFEITEQKIMHISKHFKSYMIRKVEEDKLKKQLLEKMLSALIERLTININSAYDLILNNYIKSAQDSQIECLYILNDTGKQISNTCFYDYHRNKRKRLLFIPAAVGTDHSLKEYFYRLVNGGINKYYSEPYISMATGNVCVTLSIEFKNQDNAKNILCVDYQHK